MTTCVRRWVHLWVMVLITTGNRAFSYILPSVTLLASGPEVQYVALRNILLIIQRRPAILREDVKVFFCKYNDPIYVKLAKLEIIYRLALESNAREALPQLHECVGPASSFVRFLFG